MRFQKLFIQAISRVLIVVFSTNVAFAYKPQESLWDSRQKSKETQLASLPANLGPSSYNSLSRTQIQQQLLKQIPSVKPTLKEVRSSLLLNKKNQPKILANLPESFFTNVNVRDVHQTNSKNSVVLLEDVHLNKEAQLHLSQAIKSFGEEKGTTPVLVGLEGAHGKFLYDIYKQFSDRETASLVADSFLDSGEISGPAHAGFTSYNKEGVKGLAFWGVDDDELYRQNVAAYKDSSKLKPSVEKNLAQLTKQIEKEKSKIFNSELLSFDGKVKAYRTGTLSLAEYVKTLSAFDVPTSFNVETFLQAYDMERSMDFNLIEAERTSVLEKLVKNMDQGELENLLQFSLAYQEGNVTFAEYYNHLRDVCDKNKINLAQTPHFDSYIRYVLLTDGIKTEPLFKEITQLEKAVFDRLAVNVEQKELIADSRRLYLMEELIDFSMTTDQWEEYSRTCRGAACCAQKPGNSHLGVACYAPTMKHFESFYESADARSQKMVSNLLAKNSQTSILVAGGFHSAGLTKLLKEKNISYIVATPKITKIDFEKESHYLSVFDREKSSLEKIFTGEKLFTAPIPAGAATPALKGQPNTLVAILEACIVGRYVKNLSLTTLEKKYLNMMGFQAEIKATTKDKVTTVEFKSISGRALAVAALTEVAINRGSSLHWKKVSSRTFGQFNTVSFTERSFFAFLRQGWNDLKSNWPELKKALPALTALLLADIFFKFIFSQSQNFIELIGTGAAVGGLFTITREGTDKALTKLNVLGLRTTRQPELYREIIDFFKRHGWKSLEGQKRSDYFFNKGSIIVDVRLRRGYTISIYSSSENEKDLGNKIKQLVKDLEAEGLVQAPGKHIGVIKTIGDRVLISDWVTWLQRSALILICSLVLFSITHQTLFSSIQAFDVSQFFPSLPHPLWPTVLSTVATLIGVAVVAEGKPLQTFLGGFEKSTDIPENFSLIEPSSLGTVAVVKKKDSQWVVQLLRLDAKRTPLTLLESSIGITALRFINDGKTLVVGYQDGKVNVYDTATGKEKWKQTPLHSSPPISAFGFDSKNNLLAAEDPHLDIQLFNGDFGVPKNNYFSREVRGSNVAFDSHGNVLIVQQNSIRTAPGLDKNSFRNYSQQLSPMVGDINNLILSPDGNRFVATGPQGTVLYQFSFQTNRWEMKTLIGAIHNTPAGSKLSFTSDGTVLAGVDVNGFVCLWDCQSGNLIQRMSESKISSVSSLFFEPNSKTLVVVDESGHIQRWPFKPEDRSSGMNLNLQSVLVPLFLIVATLAALAVYKYSGIKIPAESFSSLDFSHLQNSFQLSSWTGGVAGVNEMPLGLAAGMAMGSLILAPRFYRSILEVDNQSHSRRERIAHSILDPSGRLGAAEALTDNRSSLYVTNTDTVQEHSQPIYGNSPERLVPLSYSPSRKRLLVLEGNNRFLIWNLEKEVFSRKVDLKLTARGQLKFFTHGLMLDDDRFVALNNYEELVYVDGERVWYYDRSKMVTAWAFDPILKTLFIGTREGEILSSHDFPDELSHPLLFSTRGEIERSSGVPITALASYEMKGTHHLIFASENHSMINFAEGYKSRNIQDPSLGIMVGIQVSPDGKKALVQNMDGNYFIIWFYRSEITTIKVNFESAGPALNPIVMSFYGNDSLASSYSGHSIHHHQLSSREGQKPAGSPWTWTLAGTAIVATALLVGAILAGTHLAAHPEIISNTLHALQTSWSHAVAAADVPIEGVLDGTALAMGLLVGSTIPQGLGRLLGGKEESAPSIDKKMSPEQTAIEEKIREIENNIEVEKRYLLAFQGMKFQLDPTYFQIESSLTEAKIIKATNEKKRLQLELKNLKKNQKAAVVSVIAATLLIGSLVLLSGIMGEGGVGTVLATTMMIGYKREGLVRFKYNPVRISEDHFNHNVVNSVSNGRNNLHSTLMEIADELNQNIVAEKRITIEDPLTVIIPTNGAPLPVTISFEIRNGYLWTTAEGVDDFAIYNSVNNFHEKLFEKGFMEAVSALPTTDKSDKVRTGTSLISALVEKTLYAWKDLATHHRPLLLFALLGLAATGVAGTAGMLLAGGSMLAIFFFPVKIHSDSQKPRDNDELNSAIKKLQEAYALNSKFLLENNSRLIELRAKFTESPTGLSIEFFPGHGDAEQAMATPPLARIDLKFPGENQAGVTFSINFSPAFEETLPSWKRPTALFWLRELSRYGVINLGEKEEAKFTLRMAPKLTRGISDFPALLRRALGMYDAKFHKAFFNNDKQTIYSTRITDKVNALLFPFHVNEEEKGYWRGIDFVSKNEVDIFGRVSLKLTRDHFWEITVDKNSEGLGLFFIEFLLENGLATFSSELPHFSSEKKEPRIEGDGNWLSSLGYISVTLLGLAAFALGCVGSAGVMAAVPFLVIAYLIPDPGIHDPMTQRLKLKLETPIELPLTEKVRDEMKNETSPKNLLLKEIRISIILSGLGMGVVHLDGETISVASFNNHKANWLDLSLDRANEKIIISKVRYENEDDFYKILEVISSVLADDGIIEPVHIQKPAKPVLREYKLPNEEVYGYLLVGALVIAGIILDSWSTKHGLLGGMTAAGSSMLAMGVLTGMTVATAPSGFSAKVLSAKHSLHQYHVSNIPFVTGPPNTFSSAIFRNLFDLEGSKSDTVLKEFLELLRQNSWIREQFPDRQDIMIDAPQPFGKLGKKLTGYFKKGNSQEIYRFELKFHLGTTDTVQLDIQVDDANKSDNFKLTTETLAENMMRQLGADWIVKQQKIKGTWSRASSWTSWPFSPFATAIILGALVLGSLVYSHFDRSGILGGVTVLAVGALGRPKKSVRQEIKSLRMTLLRTIKHIQNFEAALTKNLKKPEDNDRKRTSKINKQAAALAAHLKVLIEGPLKKDPAESSRAIKRMLRNAPEGISAQYTGIILGRIITTDLEFLEDSSIGDSEKMSRLRNVWVHSLNALLYREKDVPFQLESDPIINRVTIFTDPTSVNLSFWDKENNKLTQATYVFDVKNKRVLIQTWGATEAEVRARVFKLNYRLQKYVIPILDEADVSVVDLKASKLKSSRIRRSSSALITIGAILAFGFLYFLSTQTGSAVGTQKAGLDGITGLLLIPAAVGVAFSGVVEFSMDYFSSTSRTITSFAPIPLNIEKINHLADKKDQATLRNQLWIIINNFSGQIYPDKPGSIGTGENYIVVFKGEMEIRFVMHDSESMYLLITGPSEKANKNLAKKYLEKLFALEVISVNPKNIKTKSTTSTDNFSDWHSTPPSVTGEGAEDPQDVSWGGTVTTIAALVLSAKLLEWIFTDPTTGMCMSGLLVVLLNSKFWHPADASMGEIRNGTIKNYFTIQRVYSDDKSSEYRIYQNSDSPHLATLKIKNADSAGSKGLVSFKVKDEFKHNGWEATLRARALESLVKFNLIDLGQNGQAKFTLAAAGKLKEGVKKFKDPATELRRVFEHLWLSDEGFENIFPHWTNFTPNRVTVNVFGPRGAEANRESWVFVVELNQDLDWEITVTNKIGKSVVNNSIQVIEYFLERGLADLSEEIKPDSNSTPPDKPRWSLPIDDANEYGGPVESGGASNGSSAVHRIMDRANKIVRSGLDYFRYTKAERRRAQVGVDLAHVVELSQLKETGRRVAEIVNRLQAAVPTQALLGNQKGTQLEKAVQSGIPTLVGISNMKLRARVAASLLGLALLAPVQSEGQVLGSPTMELGKNYGEVVYLGLNFEQELAHLDEVIAKIENVHPSGINFAFNQTRGLAENELNQLQLVAQRLEKLGAQVAFEKGTLNDQPRDVMKRVVGAQGKTNFNVFASYLARESRITTFTLAPGLFELDDLVEVISRVLGRDVQVSIETQKTLIKTATLAGQQA